MRILVAGGEGRIGRQVVEMAGRHGHDVSTLEGASSRAELSDAVRGFDVVASTLVLDGAGGDAAVKDVSADLVRAMVGEGVDRLVVASWAGAGDHASELGLVRRARLFLAGADIPLADIVEGDVMLSELDWTIVRVHGVNDHPRTGHYRVVEGPLVPKGAAMPRGDVAAFLAKTVEAGRYARRIVSIAR